MGRRPDGSLVYAAGDGPLLAVAPEAGPPTVLSRDGRARGEGHGFRSAVVIEQELERTERFLRRWELER